MHQLTVLHLGPEAILMQVRMYAHVLLDSCRENNPQDPEETPTQGIFQYLASRTHLNQNLHMLADTLFAVVENMIAYGPRGPKCHPLLSVMSNADAELITGALVVYSDWQDSFYSVRNTFVQDTPFTAHNAWLLEATK